MDNVNPIARISLTVLAALCAVTLSSHPVLGQMAESDIVRLMQDHSVPGLALAIVTPDSIVLEGFGTARADGSMAVTADTPFRLASAAKVLVAATVLVEARAGRLHLQADIAPLVDVQLEGRYAGPITLHDLMTHSAGFDERLVGYAARQSSDMRPLGEYLADRMPARGWPAGALISYSNHGMALAAYVVERAAGRSFAAVASTRLFNPLGMTSTGFLTRGRAVPEMAAEPMSCANLPCTVLPHVYSHAYPAGLAFSTARDMSRFITALVSGGETPEGLEDLIPARFTNDPRIPGMSYGFFNQVHGGRRVLAHSGTVPGYSSLLLVVPDEQIGFFFVTNGGDAAFGAALRDVLLASTLGTIRSREIVPRRTEDPAGRTGPYELTRYSHDTIERFPQVFNNALYVDSKGDTLIIFGERYLQVDDSLYQEVDGEKLLAFGTRDDKPYLFRGSDVYGARLPAAYERRKTSPSFLNEYVSWLVALPLLVMLLGWPILSGLSAFLRRRRGEDSPGFNRARLLATLSAALTAVLFLWFGFGFVALSNRLFETGEIFFGMPADLKSLVWIPPVHAGLTALLCIAVPIAWKKHWWGWVRRAVFSLLVAALALQVAFLVSWNYLPAAW